MKTIPDARLQVAGCRLQVGLAALLILYSALFILPSANAQPSPLASTGFTRTLMRATNAEHGRTILGLADTNAVVVDPIDRNINWSGFGPTNVGTFQGTNATLAGALSAASANFTTGGTTNHAGGFHGNGAGLTNLGAANIAAGGTFPALNVGAGTNGSGFGILFSNSVIPLSAPITTTATNISGRRLLFSAPRLTNQIVTESLATNFHASLLYTDPSSGSNFLFGATRWRSAAMSLGDVNTPETLVRYSAFDLSDATRIDWQLGCTNAEQIVSIGTKLYLFFANGSSQSAFVYEVDPITLESNLVITTTGQIADTSTISTDGTYIYLCNGKTGGSQNVVKYQTDGTPVGTNDLGAVSGPGSWRVGYLAHAMINDGTHLFVAGAQNNSSAWVVKVLASDMSTVSGVLFTNAAFPTLGRPTDDMCDTGQSIWMGAEYSGGSPNSGVIRVRKDLSGAEFIPCPSAGQCFGVAFDGRHVWAAFSDGTNTLCRIDPNTLEVALVDVAKLGGMKNLNEIQTDGTSLWLTSWRNSDYNPQTQVGRFSIAEMNATRTYFATTNMFFVLGVDSAGTFIPTNSGVTVTAPRIYLWNSNGAALYGVTSAATNALW